MSLAASNDPSRPASDRGKLRRWAWAPIPVLLLATLALGFVNIPVAYEVPLLVMGLNFVTRTLACLWIMFLSGRSFLKSGAPGLLLLGCGAAIWGISGFIASPSLAPDVNFSAAVSSVGLWVSALCHLTGVVLSIGSARNIRPVRLWLGLCYGISLCLVGLVVVAKVMGWLPTFVIGGLGGTAVRSIVLGSCFVMLTLAVALLEEANRRSWSSFRRWYAAALALMAVAVLGLLIEPSYPNWLTWISRTAQSLIGIYLFLALLAAMRESGVSLRSLERPVPPQGMPYRYVVAFTFVITAAAVRLAFLQVLGTSSFFISFYPAVMLAALYGGFGPGMLAALVSAMLTDYFMARPAGRLFVNTPAEWLAISVFLVGCAMVSTIAEALRHAQRRAIDAETQSQIVAARQRDLEALRESEDRLRFALETSRTGAWDLDLTNQAMVRSPEYEQIFGYDQPLSTWTYERFLEHVLPEERPAVDTALQAAITAKGVWFQEFRIRRADGVVRWVWAASRYRVDANEAKEHVVGIVQDVTERKNAEFLLQQTNAELERRVSERTTQLAAANADLRDQVEAYKRLESEVAGLVEADRVHVGMELHDNLCQQIAATGMLASSLAKRLRSQEPSLNELTSRIVSVLSDIGGQAHKMARGLLPVQIEPAGLMMALGALAQQTQEMQEVNCEFRCAAPVPVENTTTATYLFRIAQEAIHNAVRHGRARHITITLSGAEGVVLEVCDDGVGISSAAERSTGSGLRIMAYRARVIGGDLKITANPHGGTLVQCSLSKGARQI
ncbi:MAG TPA: DUF4118 domain-containing protein [Phycisphaerae bacterium]|nr:DUF4118 domain-containing protein [Phycisphaerae bacterium]